MSLDNTKPLFEITPDYQNIIDNLKHKIIPENYPDSENDMLWGEHTLNCSSLFARDKIIELSGFSFVSYEWVRPLAKWIGNRKCLEIMCGSGILSKALQNCKVKIIATDDCSWKPEECFWFKSPWTTIIKLDCIEAIEKYGRDVDIIVCSWAYMDDTAHRALVKMREINPECVMIFIGEGQGGCAANDSFYESLKEIQDFEFQESVNNYKQSWGIHDFPMLVK